jgi:glycosyltransferase involved in cell wall biosynthesis
VSTLKCQVSTPESQVGAFSVESWALKLAIVHDWLTGMRGGEKALEVLCERYPQAELFTLFHVRGSVSPAIERLPIHTSFVQHLPQVRRLYRQYLPVFPTAIEQFSFDRFDLIVSLSHCCAKSIVHPGTARHLCYCLTPMRYAWDQFDAYFGPQRIGRIRSAMMRPVMARLARWDRDTANRVDRYVAISHYVAGRIRRYYNHQPSVIYPPVDTGFFHPDQSGPSGFALVVSALVPYKRIDLAIAACRLAGVSLKIVGDGPERASLERTAGPDVQFLGRRRDEEI